MRHIQIYKNIVYVFAINLNLEEQVGMILLKWRFYGFTSRLGTKFFEVMFL